MSELQETQDLGHVVDGVRAAPFEERAAHLRRHGVGVVQRRLDF